MKKAYFDIMFEKMRENEDIFMVFCGLGYPRYEDFKAAYLERVINVEASEQAGLDIACGLAVSGKIPFVYSITPFLLWRAAETTRTYINHEKLNIKLIGAGRDEEYGLHDGFSHSATDDKNFINLFDNIGKYWPDDENELRKVLDHVTQTNIPVYINIKR